MGFETEEFAKWTKKNNEECIKRTQEIKERIEDKMCYCDLQRLMPFQQPICDFCYEKAREELDQDMLADMSDAFNKDVKEQRIHNPENTFMPLRSKKNE